MQSESIGALVSAIGAVMAEVGYVRGTGRNSHHKYSYTSDEDLAAAVQPALVKHGVAIFPVACQLDRSGDRCVIVQTWRVAHSSGEWMQIEIAGEGVDKQDKGTAKALTGARKYLLRLLFCIPTGDDIEREGQIAMSNAPRDVSEFVSGLMDRIEGLQRAGVKNAGAAGAKLMSHARAGATDDEIKTTLSKLLDWIEASEGAE
jgi:hypothetical protein